MSSVINTKRLDKEALSKVQMRYKRAKRLYVVFGAIGAVSIFLGAAVNAMPSEKSLSMDMIGGLGPILGAFFLFSAGLLFMMARALKTYIAERETREKNA